MKSQFHTFSFLAFIIIAIATNSTQSTLFLSNNTISNSSYSFSDKIYFNVETTITTYIPSIPLIFIVSINLNIYSSNKFGYSSIIAAVNN